MKSKRKATALLREYIRRLIAEEANGRSLRVFDFDDTLVVTDAVVRVTDAYGTTFALTPAQFAVYEKKPGDVFDYSDFRDLINPRAIAWTSRILRNVYSKHGPRGVAVLTARSTAQPISDFLHALGIEDIEVVALGNADPLAKAKQVDEWIHAYNLDLVEFFDDSHKNVAAVAQLRKLHPNVKIIARHVVHTHPPTHGTAKLAQGSSH